jgi:hypothetical protein
LLHNLRARGVDLLPAGGCGECRSDCNHHGY